MWSAKFRQIDASAEQVPLGHPPKPWLPKQAESEKVPLSFVAFCDDGGTLVVCFRGDYPKGSKGAACGHRLVGISEQLIETVAPRALVVDLSDLSYRWGDEMESIFRIDPNLPQATVVSEKNRSALSTLVFGMQTKRDITDRPDVFDSINASLA